MRKYIKFIFGSLFLIFSITLLIIYAICSKNQPIMPKDRISQLLNSSESLNNWYNGAHSFQNNTNFWIFYLGFDNFLEFNGNSSWTFYAIDLYIFLPILGAITFVMFSSWGIRYWFLSYRRVSLKNAYKYLNILWWSSLLLCTLFTILSMIIVQTFERTEAANSLFKNWYGTTFTDGKVIRIDNNNIILDSLKLFSVIIQSSNLNHLRESVGSLYFSAMIMLIFVASILAFLSLVLFSFYNTSRSILVSYRLLGQRKENIIRWMNYKNIPSKKEMRSRYFLNYSLILISIAFFFSMIFPAWIPIGAEHHPISSSFLIIISSLLIGVGFIPTYFIIAYVSLLKLDKYNLLITIQIILLAVLGLLWQVIVWLFFNNKFIYLDFVPLITFLIYIILSIFSYILFVRDK